MFSEITGSYDLMNWIMSLGFDGLWRKSAAKESLIEKKIYSVMDIAAGTGDFSIAINKACIKEGKKVVIPASISTTKCWKSQEERRSIWGLR